MMMRLTIRKPATSSDPPDFCAHVAVVLRDVLYGESRRDCSAARAGTGAAFRSGNRDGDFRFRVLKHRGACTI